MDENNKNSFLANYSWITRHPHLSKFRLFHGESSTGPGFKSFKLELDDT